MNESTIRSRRRRRVDSVEVDISPINTETSTPANAETKSDNIPSNREQAIVEHQTNHLSHYRSPEFGNTG